MIQVSNLSKAYGTQVIFDDVSFTVNPGERIGLVGRNGHGKTTLLRLITGEERPDTGVISVPGNYAIGYLSQHLVFSQDSVLKEGALGLKPSDDGRDETYKVEVILSGLGFPEKDFHRHPLELSGGYQVRLNLAKLLVSEPDLLLLDEPTNYLDVVSIRWLSKFLRGWKGELILITHDREFMDGVTTHTMGIHRQKIRKIAGPTHKLYGQILMEEEVYEQTRINEEKRRKEVEQFIDRFRAQANRASLVQSKIKLLQRKDRLEKMSALKDLEFEFVPAPFSGKVLVEARDVSFSFDKDIRLIEGLNLVIGKKDRIAVIGRNGKGKTTLLNLLAGELQPQRGSVSRHSQLRLAYFGQTNIQRLSPEKTVEEEILDARPDLSRGAARKICGIMMFEGDSALKRIRVLSGGEKSRVLLGKLIVSPANLLLLDEPTNHLDMESIDSLVEAMDEFEGALVIVTHSEMILRAIATRLVVFDGDNAEVFDGTYQDFLDRGGWKDEKAEEEYCIKNSSAKGNGSNRKDFKRAKAELINDRSRVLTPLQTKVAEVEESIMILEQELGQDTQLLIDASVRSDGDAIRRLSRSVRESKDKIDLLFGELESLTDELESRTKEFEEKLEALKATG